MRWYKHWAGWWAGASVESTRIDNDDRQKVGSTNERLKPSPNGAWRLWTLNTHHTSWGLSAPLVHNSSGLRMHLECNEQGIECPRLHIVCSYSHQRVSVFVLYLVSLFCCCIFVDSFAKALFRLLMDYFYNYYDIMIIYILHKKIIILFCIL